MKKRHPAAVLLLPIITLGIYCIYWLYATRKEILARINSKNAIPPVTLLVLPVLLMVLLFVVGLLATGGENMTHDTDISTDESLDAAGIITLILLGMFFVGAALVLPLWWFWKYCKAAALVVKGYGMDFTQSYILYVAISWLCGIMPVWMLIQQLDYNKIANASGDKPHHPGHAKTTVPAA